MATNYPNSGNDVFNVPISPSTTPLSSAGSGSRNHVQHHQDLGDAVMALQANATQKTHLHGGLGMDGPKLSQSNTHQNVDTDGSDTSIHHTLGVTPFQSAKGNHQHSQYVDLTTTQTISGVKTFGSGMSAPVIPDFSASQHKHISPASGGPAFPATDSSSWDYGSFIFDLKSTLKVDMTAPFVIPPNVKLYGVAYLQYTTVVYTGETTWDVGAAVSYGPSGVTYSPTENITTLGSSGNIGLSQVGRFAYGSGMASTASGAANKGISGTLSIPFSLTYPGNGAIPNSRLKIFLVGTTNSGFTLAGYVQYWFSPLAAAATWSS